MIAAAALAVCLVPPLAWAAGRLESVAQFYQGQTHLDLEIFHADDGSKLGMVTIENPLRIRGQPTTTVVIQPAQWPELVGLWRQARAGVTGTEPWTTVGAIGEIDGGPAPPRLTLSTGPAIRFAFGATIMGVSFELAPADVDAMDKALAHEQQLLAGRDRPRRRR
jgi:hypothetical protein